MKIKILFTIQWFPSVLSANVLCDENIISSLVDTGKYDVTCLVYSTPEIKKEEIIDDVSVYRFRKGLLWDKVVQVKRNPFLWYSKWLLTLDLLLQRIRQILYIPIYPIMEPRAVRKFSQNAIKLHKREHFDIVVSEHNGIDSLLAGYYLKKYDPQIKFVPIFWDPLFGKEPAKYLPKAYSLKKQRNLEDRIMKCADKAVFMELYKPFHDRYSVNYGTKGIYLSFPKIKCDSSSVHEDKYNVKGKINIVYSGVLNMPDRDPSLFLKALAHSKYAKDINLIFFCAGDGREVIHRFSTDFIGHVINSSYIPVDELKTVYSNADILLNLGGPNPNMVPSKIYDYISACKPIISTYYIDDESSMKVLEKYTAAICIDLRADVDDNAEKLDAFIEQVSSFNIDIKDVESIYHKNLPRCYVDLLENL